MGDELLNNLIKKVIEEEYSKYSIEDYHPFVRKIIQTFSFDIHNYEDIINIGQNCKTALFLNYYADAQLTILKKYLEDRDSITYTDEEVMQKVNNTKLKFWYKLFFYPLNNLTDYERARIYNDFSILRKLNDRKVLPENRNVTIVLEDSESFDFKCASDKFTTLYNIKNKYELLRDGLQTFIDDVVPLILEMPVNEDNEDLIFPFMIWQDENKLQLRKK